MTEVIKFESVGLRYGLGPEVLQDISFNLETASFHFLIGPSGAGKSSLLRLMYLAHRQTRGIISLFGRDTASLPRTELPKLRRRIGVMFQDFRLLPHLTAFDNVALPLRVAGMKETKIKRYVEELLVWVGLENHMDVRPTTMSGGQQQRIAIARAVIARPKILYADEPTGNVDDRIAARLMHLFDELNKLGTTVIIATHNESIIQEFRRPILRIESGRLTVVPLDKDNKSSDNKSNVKRATQLLESLSPE
ncbi:MAG: cell division ATP-binding protein FtsE [Rhodospirillales bacterium]|nr:cell division ATP-binding protein FtsE [Rhodospirillales bacterium]MDC0988988.1 cell division ATP-binding protein FtsE [Rhodospirillales bacterium]|tara:strand:- start:14 stop:763 length:750 start_codon:yes stop_codon:yes gene_type:complete